MNFVFPKYVCVFFLTNSMFTDDLAPFSQNVIIVAKLNCLVSVAAFETAKMGWGINPLSILYEH